VNVKKMAIRPRPCLHGHIQPLPQPIPVTRSGSTFHLRLDGAAEREIQLDAPFP
jgi:hypothetical protein